MNVCKPNLNGFILHYASGCNSTEGSKKMTMRVVLQQVLLEIYGVAGKCFIILCTSVTAALAEMNYSDRRWEEERAEEGEGGRKSGAGGFSFL